MSVILVPLLVVLRAICDLVYFTVILYAIVETLVAFDILTPRNPRLYKLRNSLCYLMEPVLQPIRQRVPVFRNFDLATLVLLLAVLFIRVMISMILGMFFVW